MGGKNKQSQRTKNNARPSSSGRSAELLSNSVRAESGTVLAGGKALPALFPSLAASALDTTMPAEFALCFKKLNKKDPITRTKALQELTELVGGSGADAAVAALAGWAAVYRALAADPDRRVREHAQICHGAVVGACGRRAAPALRALLPAWLQAQHDDHAPARAHARRTLESTFPAEKLPAAVAYCREEVAAHALPPLLQPGAAAAAAAHRVESPEEREQLQLSATIGALHTLRALATALPGAHREWLAATLAPLLAHAAFWQLRASPEPRLRAAWYAAVGAVWARAGPHLAVSHTQQALRLALAAREPCGVVAPHYWAALLHILHSTPNWYELLDKKELLLKRILDLVENGGWGGARALGDALLPLLALLPPALAQRPFYTDLFRASLAGLVTKNVISSKSERQWWIASLAECLRYLSIQSEEFVVEVVTGAHREWLEAVTALPDAQTRAHLVRHSAANMTSLLKYWLKLSKQEKGEKFDQLVRNFWQNVGATMTRQIDKTSTEADDVASLIECHTVLLHTLKVSFLQETKKQQSIKFEGDAKVEESVMEQGDTICDAADTARYVHNLNDLACKICGGYFEFARQKQMASVFGCLLTLLLEFDSEELWAALARQLGADSLYSLYEAVLRGWLRGDAMRCEPLVDVVFLLMKHLTETEQDAVFDSFEQLAPCVVEWCVGVALSHPARALAAARRWLRAPPAERAVLGACGRALRDGDDRCKNLLLMCLSQDDHGELAVSESCLWRVVEQVCEGVTSHGDGVTSQAGTSVTSQAGTSVTSQADTSVTSQADTSVTSQAGGGTSQAGTSVTSQAGTSVTSQANAGVTSPVACVRLAAALAAALPPRVPRLHLQLATSMFHLNLHVPLGDPRLPADSWVEARGCWQEPPAPAARALQAAAAPAARRRLQSETFDIREIEHVASLCPYLLSGCEREQPDASEVVALTQLLFDFPPEDSSGANIEAGALRYDCMRANLNCLFDDDNDHIKRVIDESASVDAADFTKEALISHLNKLLFRAIYLRTVLLRKPGDEDEGETRCWCDALLQDKYMVEQLTRVLYDYCVLCSLHEGYAYWPHYGVIQQAVQKLTAVLDDVVAATGAGARAAVLAALADMAAAVGYYWSFARRWYAVRSGADAGGGGEGAGGGGGEEDTPLEDIVTGNGFFHTMQANSKGSADPGARLRTSYLTMLRSLYAAHSGQPDVIDDQFVRDAAETQASCGADVLVNLYYRHKHTMLYDRDITDAPWAEVVATAAAARYLAALVAAAGWDAPPHHWDFATIALCSLLDTLHHSRAAWGTTKVAMLAHSVCELYVAVEQFVGGVRQQCVQREPPAHVAQLPQEWADVFAPHAALRVTALVLSLLESPSADIAAGHACYIAALSRAARAARWPRAPPAAPPLERVARAACDVLRAHRHHALVYFAHGVLLALADPLVLEDAEKLAAWEALAAAEDDEESAARSKPALALAYWRPAVAQLAADVDTMLQPFRIGEDTCSLQPHTAAYNMTLAYLLLSDALHCELCSRQRQDLAMHYIEMLRGDRMSELLLTAALRLLPPALAAHVGAGDAAAAPAPQRCLDMFTSVKSFDVYEAPLSSDIGALACRGAYGACAGAGRGAARAWWGAAQPRAARAAARLVAAGVAPPLVQRQLRDLHARRHQLQHAQISIAWSSLEATCSYRVEETPLAVTVAFSAEHPLRPPRVAAPHRAAPPAAAHWLQLYLAYQNGSLVKAFEMWMRAVSVKLERAPQCYICYCRLHPSSGRLPAAPCHQCGNKFHTQCLRKWFSTSNKSNCPLCRGTF